MSTNDPFNDPFFRRGNEAFDSHVKKTAGLFGAGFLGCGLLSIVLNLAFWGAVIAIACWALHHWHVFH